MRNKIHEKFKQDMERGGLLVQDYQSIRFHHHAKKAYNGPAVIADNPQDALSHTMVICNCDNIGQQFIIYPK